MGNTQCVFCSTPTNILNYSCKFKKNICNTCVVHPCSQCNKLYTYNLIHHDNKLYCIKCVEELLYYNSLKNCSMCNKKCVVRIIHYQYKGYCNDCIDNISGLCYRINKKLK